VGFPHTLFARSFVAIAEMDGMLDRGLLRLFAAAPYQTSGACPIYGIVDAVDQSNLEQAPRGGIIK